MLFFVPNLTGKPFSSKFLAANNIAGNIINIFSNIGGFRKRFFKISYLSNSRPSNSNYIGCFLTILLYFLIARAAYLKAPRPAT